MVSSVTSTEPLSAWFVDPCIIAVILLRESLINCSHSSRWFKLAQARVSARWEFILAKSKFYREYLICSTTKEFQT